MREIMLALAAYSADPQNYPQNFAGCMHNTLAPKYSSPYLVPVFEEQLQVHDAQILVL